MRSYNHWNDEMKNDAFNYLKSGKSYSATASALNEKYNTSLTVDSIDGMLQKNGWSKNKLKKHYKNNAANTRNNIIYDDDMIKKMNQTHVYNNGPLFAPDMNSEEAEDAMNIINESKNSMKYASGQLPNDNKKSSNNDKRPITTFDKVTNGYFKPAYKVKHVNNDSFKEELNSAIQQQYAENIKDTINIRDRIKFHKMFIDNDVDEQELSDNMRLLFSTDEETKHKKAEPVSLTDIINKYDNIQTYTQNVKSNLRNIYYKCSLKNGHIVSLSDMHIPYIDLQAFKVIMDSYSNTNENICVLNGDILNADSFSSFNNIKQMSLKEELEFTEKIINVISSKFKYVVWVRGNHDSNRFGSYIRKRMDEETAKYINDVADPINFIASKFDNVIVTENNFCEINNIIFSHPARFCSVPMKTAINEYTARKVNKEILPNQDFNALVAAHTHYAGEVIIHGDKVIEQGCLSTLPPYKIDKIGSRSWVVGFVDIEVSEGTADINDISFISLGKAKFK